MTGEGLTALQKYQAQEVAREVIRELKSEMVLSKEFVTFQWQVVLGYVLLCVALFGSKLPLGEIISFLGGKL